jgi:dipeptidyl-peptidase III
MKINFTLKNTSSRANKIKITDGDLEFIMEGIIKNLKYAKFYASNNQEKKMLECYIEHFTTGREHYFRDALVAWVKNKNPSIEFEIGFQETYLDPLGVRAEFEGLLAIVDKKESELYTTLVNNAESMIKYFPWPMDFENETFKKPDYTSLKVIALGSSSVCLGQNLPNYDDLREDHGYKNYTLTNAAPKVSSKNIQFATEEMNEFIPKYANESLDLKVSLHELLGHGSGRLLVKNVETGEFNFDYENLINPLTGKKIESWYMSNETWHGKFKKLHSAYEECRADTVAMYLSHFKEPYEILFKGRESEWDDIQYVMWHEVIRRGLFGLIYYDDKNDKWGQAHVIGNYVIMRVIYEAQGVFTIDLTQKDGKDYFILTLNKEKIKTEGHEAIKKFLQKLQILKCTGDYDTAQEWFGNYMKVDEFFLKIREIAIQNKQPRRLELMPNLVLTKEGKVEYKLYEESHEGIVQASVDSMPNILDVPMFEEWLKNAEKFRIPS